jgi:hypothetical protein
MSVLIGAGKLYDTQTLTKGSTNYSQPVNIIGANGNTGFSFYSSNPTTVDVQLSYGSETGPWVTHETLNSIAVNGSAVQKTMSDRANWVRTKTVVGGGADAVTTQDVYGRNID